MHLGFKVREIGGETCGTGRCGMERSNEGARANSTIDRIMLRFRPIAPKPADYGTPSGKLSTEENSTLIINGNTKRKYAKFRKKKQCKRRTTPDAGEVGRNGSYKRPMTPLLSPERSVGEGFSTGEALKKDSRVWLNFENPATDAFTGASRRSSLTALIPPAAREVESWVTMESVTDTCVDGEGLGLTDEERIKNLGKDRSPGFISDGQDLVQWVNEAYKKMVGIGHENDWPELDFRVWLVMKERLTIRYDDSFASMVRVEYTWHDRKCSKIVPCDVWRMDGGGFAWRLDLAAALSLGI
ncbi:hypothetical protein U1Q18_012549 [Sarracenia purpurea var. burkii]